MPVTIAVPQETADGEKRVALVPTVAAKLAAAGAKIQIQHDAGASLQLTDAAYEGAEVVADAASLYGGADLILKVRPPAVEEVRQFKEGSVYLGFLAPHASDEQIRLLAERRITAFSVELIPRISRAQSMDALSSQASAAGYQAALLAAVRLNRFFPMLTTAAGTIRPATVLVIGAGVAGLQAIATAKRLGAQVEAYDVRAAAKEQVASLGARFVEMDVKAEGSGGYARELTDEERARQQEVLAKHVAKADAVITTAAVPGRPAPTIVTEAMVEQMKPGAVIIDLAAETGGNCALTQPGKTIEHGGVIIEGPLNVPSQLAEHASEMYAKNLQNFLSLILKDGELSLDWEDEILAGSVVTHDGEIKHQPTRERLEGAAA
ncbi:MAG: Re/Si-specific NAD(P)(+) transhydrogenase subunit alpha [Pseudomonadota bacterium]|nr:Re/Si-specific NAD(P)(+) transhydrogenase subunit alpha [Pseudomonadota bacterium]HJO35952.1 Re/Si-specific NAD(P)(+) transhydrogenase subunit alpha [Gammaproteobacteria bacterium]